jgi:hypothetical protein
VVQSLAILPFQRFRCISYEICGNYRPLRLPVFGVAWATRQVHERLYVPAIRIRCLQIPCLLRFLPVLPRCKHVDLRCPPPRYVCHLFLCLPLTRVALVATGSLLVQILKMMAVAYGIYLAVFRKLAQHPRRRPVRPDADTVLAESCDLRRA